MLPFTGGWGGGAAQEGELFLCLKRYSTLLLEKAIVEKHCLYLQLTLMSPHTPSSFLGGKYIRTKV